MNRTFSPLPWLASLLFALVPLHAEVLKPEAHYGKIAKATVRKMQQKHMSHEALSESLARRTMENFLRALDFDRTFLLAEDVAKLRARTAELPDMLKNGDVTFAFEAFNLLKERANNRVEFVFSLLDKGFDVESDETYNWRRKTEPWPADEAEWDDLWRKKVKNEYIGRLVSAEMRKRDAEEKTAEKAADTNAVTEVTVDPPKEEGDADLDDKLSPEVAIRKRYEQFLSLVNGHDAEYVLQLFLNSYTEAHDTHSNYLSPRANEDFDIHMSLSLSGIGAMLSYDEGAAKIVELIKGGPADLDGRLKVGDRIVAVAQEDEESVDVLYWPLYKTVRLIRGPKGTTVTLSVNPASDASGAEIRKVDIVRNEIKLEEKAAKSKVVEFEHGSNTVHKLGVISLPDFYQDMSGRPGGGRSCADDVERLLRELKDAEVEGLILDLRYNGGGSLPDCVRMTGFFVDRGPIVQVKVEQKAHPYPDPEPGVLFDKPLVVMVNRQSASASEILAAALQDYGRAVIVGDSKTHGKGSVQTKLPLDDSDSSMGELKVTTMGFYRVDGRSTQLKGVTPDIVIRSATDVMELGEEYLENVLPWSWVPPSAYRPYGNLRPAIRQLKEASATRLAENKNYTVFQEQIDRLAERVQRRQVSLHLEERIAQAQADRELDRLLEKSKTSGDDLPEEETRVEEDEIGETIRPQDDLLLDEALHILSDLVALEKA